MSDTKPTPAIGREILGKLEKRLQHGKKLIWGLRGMVDAPGLVEDLSGFKNFVIRENAIALVIGEGGQVYCIEETPTEWRLAPKMENYENRFNFENAIRIPRSKPQPQPPPESGGS